MTKKRVYLASPLGFAESTRSFMNDLEMRLRQYVDIENPWDDTRFADDFERLEREESTSRQRAELAKINRELGRSNTERIDRSDGVFAILDGVDVDSGTAAEIGYAFARGKRVHGLRTDFRLAGDNPGSIVNLQVEFFIRQSGGTIVTATDALVERAREYAKE